jgi:methylmalonyl-CoA mutase N-terminal domain/subunit
LPTEESALLALRTQQVIAYESGVTAVPDPFGGSYYIEELTDQIEREAKEYIERIDGMGGALTAIEMGYPQAQIQNAAYEFQRSVESGARVVVGVNRFQSEGGADVPVFRVNPEIERTQIARVIALRSARDTGAWRASLEALEAAARGTENLMPRIVAAAEALATVGEISDALRRVFGEYREGG